MHGQVVHRKQIDLFELVREEFVVDVARALRIDRREERLRREDAVLGILRGHADGGLPGHILARSEGEKLPGLVDHLPCQLSGQLPVADVNGQTRPQRFQGKIVEPQVPAPVTHRTGRRIVQPAFGTHRVPLGKLGERVGEIPVDLFGHLVGRQQRRDGQFAARTVGDRRAGGGLRENGAEDAQYLEVQQRPHTQHLAADDVVGAVGKHIAFALAVLEYLVDVGDDEIGLVPCPGDGRLAGLGGVGAQRNEGVGRGLRGVEILRLHVERDGRERLAVEIGLRQLGIDAVERREESLLGFEQGVLHDAVRRVDRQPALAAAQQQRQRQQEI